MHITRCQDQKHCTLEEFYGKDVHPEDPRPHGYDDHGAMLALLQRLRAMPDERHVYGLTSELGLCLLSHDTQSAPAFVKVHTVSKTMYFIEYLVPPHKAPWPQAYVTGMASSEDEAVQMILLGMEKSGGWSQGS